VLSRLDYPITYWNALGMLAGVGAVLGLHLSASDWEPWPVRVLAAALPPVAACTVYFTLSRGGIAATAVGLVAYCCSASRARRRAPCSRSWLRASSSSGGRRTPTCSARPSTARPRDGPGPRHRGGAGDRRRRGGVATGAGAAGGPQARGLPRTWPPADRRSRGRGGGAGRRRRRGRTTRWRWCAARRGRTRGRRPPRRCGSTRPSPRRSRRSARSGRRVRRRGSGAPVACRCICGDGSRHLDRVRRPNV